MAPTPPSVTADELTTDHLMDALGMPERRYLLAELAEDDVDPGDEFEIKSFIPDDADDKRYFTSLYQLHVPKLARMGLITINEETNAISRGPNFDTIHALIALLRANDDVLPEPLVPSQRSRR